MSEFSEFGEELRAAHASTRKFLRKKNAGVTGKAAPKTWAGFFLIWIVGIVIVSLIAWASNSEIDSIVRGSGQVIPDSSKQVIQSLEGGIIDQIFVKEGDIVSKGQALLQLDDTLYASINERNETSRDLIKARLVRLKAEVEGSDRLEFPAELLQEKGELLKLEQQLFDSRRTDQAARIRFSTNRLEKEREKYRLLSPSFSNGALPMVEKLDLEAQIFDLEEKLETTKTGFVRLAMERYDEERERLATLMAQMEGDKDRMVRTAINSPIDGIVNKIHIETSGRVVSGGEPIMEIIPQGDSLLIETKIRPADIAFLHKGQKALVNFTAYDFSIYGGLDGEIETIGVDTIMDDRTREFSYTIKVRTARGDLGRSIKTGELLSLVPGMVAEVNIITGKRTVLDYLLKPIYRAQKHALRER